MIKYTDFKPIQEENERLLKTNKELLEALKEMINSFPMAYKGEDILLQDNAIQKAKKAIKKHSPIN